MASASSVQKLSLFALTAMVVGSMVGSGIFSLPRTFGIATGPFGAIFAWCIAGGVRAVSARDTASKRPQLRMNSSCASVGASPGVVYFDLNNQSTGFFDPAGDNPGKSNPLTFAAER